MHTQDPLCLHCAAHPQPLCTHQCANQCCTPQTPCACIVLYTPGPCACTLVQVLLTSPSCMHHNASVASPRPLCLLCTLKTLCARTVLHIPIPCALTTVRNTRHRTPCRGSTAHMHTSVYTHIPHTRVPTTAAHICSEPGASRAPRSGAIFSGDAGAVLARVPPGTGASHAGTAVPRREWWLCSARRRRWGPRRTVALPHTPSIARECFQGANEP